MIFKLFLVKYLRRTVLQMATNELSTEITAQKWQICFDFYMYYL